MLLRLHVRYGWLQRSTPTNQCNIARFLRELPLKVPLKGRPQSVAEQLRTKQLENICDAEVILPLEGAVA